jgi:hypothetical protein
MWDPIPKTTKAKKTGGVAQATCIASTRPWVQTPVLPPKKKVSEVRVAFCFHQQYILWGILCLQVQFVYDSPILSHTQTAAALRCFAMLSPCQYLSKSFFRLRDFSRVTFREAVLCSKVPVNDITSRWSESTMEVRDAQMDFINKLHF